MKRIQFLLISGFLLVSPLLHCVSWAQAKPKAVSVAEAASIEGTVIDAATKRPIVGATILAKNQAGKVRAQQQVGPDGVYRLGLDDSKQAYLLITNAPGYEPHEEQVAFTITTTLSARLSGKAIRLYRLGTKPPLHQNRTTVETNVATTSAVAANPLPETTVTAPASAVQSAASAATPAPTSPRVTPPKTLDAKVVYTPPLVVAAPGKTTQLRAIQFVQSKAELLPDAQPALEQLAAFLKNNPTAEIELGGHTDNQGDFDENLRLSKQRVEVVKAYLVTNGIAANRIVTRGYGPTRPIGSNNAESTRQLNRRVEMTVLKQ